MVERKEIKTVSQWVTESKRGAGRSYAFGPQVKNVELSPLMHLVPRLIMWS
jgi:hypothetical protein